MKLLGSVEANCRLKIIKDMRIDKIYIFQEMFFQNKNKKYTFIQMRNIQYLLVHFSV